MIAWHQYQVNEAIVLGNLRLSSGLDDDPSFSCGTIKGMVRLLRYAQNDIKRRQASNMSLRGAQRRSNLRALVDTGGDG
jgi:hypothetical protein